MRQNRRGSVTLYSDTYLVKLFEDADLSTLVHETGHIFFEELRKIVDSGLADEAMLKDYNILRDWIGAIEGEELTTEQREKAARGFEAYLMEGKAPSRELKSAFSRFKKWLLAIYRKAANLNVELTDEARGVFDRMLASEAEINEAAKKNGPGGLTRKELERLGLNPDGVTSAEQLPLTARDKAAAAMRRNFMQFRKALLEDRIEAALDYNRKALLNLEFARQSMALARMAEKLPRSVRSFVGSKSAGADARYFANDIAARYGLMRESEALARGRDQGTIADWVNRLRAEGIDLFIDDNIALGKGKSWREMGVDEFGNLVETLTQIIHAEKNQRTITTAEGKLNLDAVANDIANSIYAHNNRRVIHTIQTPPAIVEAARKIHALHTKVEAICLAVDGEKMGPAWRYIYKPINDAENDQNMRLKKVRDELKNIFRTYSARELGKMGAQKVYEKAIGEKISYENRICVALNMGNAVNIRRLQEGHGWTADQINAVVKPLTAKDWNFVQSVWNYLDTFKKESFDLQQEMSGIRPKAVEAQALDVQTSDGKTLHLRGGYYPIRYNPKKGEKAYQFNGKDFFGGQNFGAAATRKGHLKERSAAGLGTPLLLQLSVVPDHVFNVAHDLSYRRAVIDVAKVMREAGFQEKPNQQMRLIRHLWLTMHDLGIVRDRRDSAIRAYIYRITKKTVGACEMADLSKVIETLKKWIDRLEDKEAQARLRREFVTMEPATPVIQ